MDSADVIAVRLQVGDVGRPVEVGNTKSVGPMPALWADQGGLPWHDDNTFLSYNALLTQ